MPTTPGSSDPSRKPKSVSDADAREVKGGMGTTSPTSPTLKPVPKPELPRFIVPCV